MKKSAGVLHPFVFTPLPHQGQEGCLLSKPKVGDKGNAKSVVSISFFN